MSNRSDFVKVVKNLGPELYCHSLFVEECMGALYDYFELNNTLGNNKISKNNWLIAGFIHDVDNFGEYKSTHPLKTKEVLSKYGLKINKQINDIILAHGPEITHLFPESLAQWSLLCADNLVGLITALVSNNFNGIIDLKTDVILADIFRKPENPNSTRRRKILMCSRIDGLNISLNKFIDICFIAMKKCVKIQCLE